MTNSVRLNGHVLRRDNGHVVKMALDLESVKIGLRMKDALCQSK